MQQPITQQQISRLGDGLPGCLLNDLLLAEPRNGIPEPLLALLQQYAVDHEPITPSSRFATPTALREDVVREEKPAPLRQVAPGPWRSLGGFLDYSGWADRERFLELDRLIASRQALEDTDDDRECLLS